MNFKFKDMVHMEFLTSDFSLFGCTKRILIHEIATAERKKEMLT